MDNKALIPIGLHKRINPNAIIMLIADGNYTYIYLQNGERLLSSINLGELEYRLEKYNFFRPTRSTLINLEHIDNLSFEYNKPRLITIQMANNAYISVSRRKIKDFEKVITRCEITSYSTNIYRNNTYSHFL